MLQGYGVGMTVVLSVAKLLAYLVLIHFHERDTCRYGRLWAHVRRAAHASFCVPPRRQPGFTPNRTERRRLFRYSFFNNFNDAGTLLLTAKSRRGSSS